MLKKTTKIMLAILGVVMAGIVILVVWYNMSSTEKVTDISQYEKYLGVNGKYKEHYGTYNDIFPDVIPENVEVKDFIYYYHNPWDACYMGYLVYSCDEAMYTAEIDRLKALPSSENIPFSCPVLWVCRAGYIHRQPGLRRPGSSSDILPRYPVCP